MTESDSKAQSQMEEEKRRLKYLEFVQRATFQALMVFTRLYGYAKENAGPLKPGVESVEGTVKTVVAPVYDKYHDVPIDLLKFVDHKVDVSVNEIDRRVQPLVKNVYEKYEPKAKNIYEKYEPVAEQYAASAWHTLHRLPLFPTVAQAVVPKAAYCTEIYNQTVSSSHQKGYKVAAYLPLVPTDKIAKVFTPATTQAH